MNKVLAISNHEGLCWKCLQSFNKSEIINITIPELGYGSIFDGEGTKLQLCKTCYEESIKDNPHLWDMKIKETKEEDLTTVEYMYEKEMYEYLESLPIQSRQFVWNEFVEGTYAKPLFMSPQDWIDYQLGILPHDKCKKYGVFSFDEIKAYDEKFSTCQYPINIIYDDGTIGCQCPFGAYGGYNQETDRYISTECYECSKYTKRTTPITTMTKDEYNQKYSMINKL